MRVRVDRVMVELRLTPAATPEAAVELMARLTLDQLEAAHGEHDSARV